MRILFAGLTSPYPPTNGHRLRTWSLVRSMAEDGHALTVVALAESREPLGDLAPLEHLCDVVEHVPAPRRVTEGTEAVKRVRALASRLPYGAWKFRAPEFTAALERHLARVPFDLVVCDGVYNVQNLPEAPGVPVLLNKDDVAYVIMERHLAVQGSRAARAYGALEVRKVRAWERRACSRVSAVLACSEHDRGIIQALAPRARVFVAPNVVDTTHYLPTGTPEPRTVLFQGGMEWHPNRDGVHFFVTQILPELQRFVPDVTFRVAGRCPSEEFRRRYERVPGVQFTGAVPDMRAEIAKAAVCVVPLRVGSGTRLKILEAGAMGKPMVSTRLGAEGLDFVDGDEMVLADTPNAFAAAVAALLGDEPRRQSMGRAARLRVEKGYSLPVLHATVREALAGARA